MGSRGEWGGLRLYDANEAEATCALLLGLGRSKVGAEEGDLEARAGDDARGQPEREPKVATLGARARARARATATATATATTTPQAVTAPRPMAPVDSPGRGLRHGPCACVCVSPHA